MGSGGKLFLKEDSLFFHGQVDDGIPLTRLLMSDHGMGMNIKDRLARLDSAPKRPAPILQPSDLWIQEMERELGIKVLSRDSSFVMLKESHFPLYRDEFFPWLRENEFYVNHFYRIQKDVPPGEVNLRDAAFIDTETTGLAGGTGTYAFLIGIGKLELDHIVVRQYLLPDFSHEWLMLSLVDGALQNARFTVSFNGKSFDIPLLKSRFILNRMMTVLEEIPHVDALHAARRIWKQRLPACDLQTLEQYVLHITRNDDIPGNLIPQIYFEFIRKRDAWILRDVLEHNFLDIVNMALLTIRMAAICESPVSHLNDPRDLFALAHYFFQNRQFDEAIPLLKFLVEEHQFPGDEGLGNPLYLLAMAYKKNGQIEPAKKYLEALYRQRVYHPILVEELAKIYEHADREFELAKEVVEKGLQYLETVRQLNHHSGMLAFLPRLRHRHQRLLKKIQRDTIA